MTGRQRIERDRRMAEMRDLLEEMKSALDPQTVFSAGRDGDLCHWCHRDISTEEGWPPLEDQHDSDCGFLIWYSRVTVILEKFKSERLATQEAGDSK